MDRAGSLALGIRRGEGDAWLPAIAGDMADEPDAGDTWDLVEYSGDTTHDQTILGLHAIFWGFVQTWGTVVNSHENSIGHRDVISWLVVTCSTAQCYSLLF